MLNDVEALGASATACARVANHDNVKWPTDREERLLELARENKLTASQMAAELGVTRNAVIGKLHRLKRSVAKPRKDPNRKRVRKAKPGKRPPWQPRWRALVEAADAELAAMECAEPVVEIAPPATAIRSVLELTPHMCRYPFGDPRHPGFCYCGGVAFEGSPYCAGHARLSYRPARER